MTRGVRPAASAASELPRDTLAFLPRRGLALGWVASAPLFLFYELGRAARPGERNTAELLLGRVLDPLGDLAHPVRWALLLAATVAALVAVARELEDESISRQVLRQVGEGLGAAILLGPLLVGLLGLLDARVEALGQGAPPHDVALGTIARVVGGAAWEELLFRVALLCGLWFLVSRLATFFTLSIALAVPLAELVALLGSSLAFAAIHLEVVSRPLGLGGEPYDPALFLWRILAGLALAVLFRWRGLGVAAWCHAFFNFALALGVGPGVLGGGR